MTSCGLSADENGTTSQNQNLPPPNANDNGSVNSNSTPIHGGGLEAAAPAPPPSSPPAETQAILEEMEGILAGAESMAEAAHKYAAGLREKARKLKLALEKAKAPPAAGGSATAVAAGSMQRGTFSVL